MDLMQLASWLSGLGQQREQRRQYDLSYQNQRDSLSQQAANLKEQARQFDALDPIRKTQVAQGLASALQAKMGAQDASLSLKAKPQMLQAQLEGMVGENLTRNLGNRKTAGEMALENFLMPFALKHGDKADEEMSKAFKNTGDNMLTTNSILKKNSGIFGGPQAFNVPQIDFGGPNPYQSDMDSLQKMIDDLQNTILSWAK